MDYLKLLGIYQSMKKKPPVLLGVDSLKDAILFFIQHLVQVKLKSNSITV